ncbi:hypothetical protein [Arthrobacter sp. UYEF36]|uniref:hypothetical protein n=1 Tax=Arthrobacter sp. UYEF36 TaxID=1756366 RepID=UPI0033929FC7
MENLLAALNGGTPSAQYGGYASCPLTTARGKMLLAEFDYTLQPAPSIPFIDTTKERSDKWLLKRYALPFMYWNDDGGSLPPSSTHPRGRAAAQSGQSCTLDFPRGSRKVSAGDRITL